VAGAAGLRPQAGFYTLLVTLAAHAIFGTSRHVGLALFVTVKQLPKLFGIEAGAGDTIRQLGHHPGRACHERDDVARRRVRDRDRRQPARHLADDRHHPVTRETESGRGDTTAALASQNKRLTSVEAVAGRLRDWAEQV
jgi:hypothetical protein